MSDSLLHKFIRWFLDAPEPRRAKPNPVLAPKHLNRKDRAAFEKARRLSREFHGSDVGIVELSPQEREPLPRFVVEPGSLLAVEYQPPEGSERGTTPYRHESGDRGPGAPASPHDPLLVVNPLTKRPAIVAKKSPVRFNGKRGLIG